MLFNHVGIDNPVEMNTVTIDGKRYYVTPQGNKYPSITTVISNNSKKQKSLAKWRARVGKEKAQGISTRSATRGTRYHKLVEDYLNNILDKTKYKDMPLPWFMFNTSQKVLDRINNIYLQEAALYSDVLKIAGRVDCIAEFDGVLSIIDFKTSAKQKPEKICHHRYNRAPKDMNGGVSITDLRAVYRALGIALAESGTWNKYEKI